MMNLFLYMGLSGCSSEPETPLDNPFMLACMGKGTEPQHDTTRALLAFLDETRCNAAWKKLTETTAIRLDNSSYPVADLSVLEGLEQVESLYLSDSLVTDLGMVKTFTNLRSLRIEHTEVSDLSPIAELKELETLLLDYSLVTDLSPISNLEKLTKIGLRGTNIEDITPLQNLTNLQYLEASRTDVTNIETLAYLKAIRILSLRETNISDLEPLKNLVELKVLDVNGANIISLKPVSGLDKLEALDISHTSITDLTPLSEMSALKEFLAVQAPILVSDCPVSPSVVHAYCQQHKNPVDDNFFNTCTAPNRSQFLTQTSLENLKSGLNISDCTELKNYLDSTQKIDLSNVVIPDPSLLSGFTNITSFQFKQEDIHPEYCPSDTKNTAFNTFCTEDLNMSDYSEDLITDCQTTIKDDGPLAHTFQTLMTVTETNNCRELKHALEKTSILHLEQQELSDISPLAHFSNLRELYLDYNDLSDISVLSKLAKLQILWIDDNNIEDISALSSLNLLWLSAGDNKISSLEPLRSQKNLTNLWLGANEIQDISPLSDLTRLKKLHLAKNQIQDVGALSDLKFLRKVYLAENQIQDFSPVQNLPNLSFLTEGLDYEESPLEAHRWFLSGNPISAEQCEVPDSLPLILSLYCYDTK